MGVRGRIKFARKPISIIGNVQLFNPFLYLLLLTLLLLA